MRVRAAWLTAIAALPAAVLADEITSLPPPVGAGVERGVAILRCSAPGGFWTSRAAILDVGDSARGDVLLTTSHGLRSAAFDIVDDCKILARGKEHDIERVWRAGDSGPEHDWAVLLTAQPIAGDVVRWRVTEAAPGWLDGLVADHARVRLVLRYADSVRTACRLEARTAQGLLAHSCTGYPGTSGTPLVVEIDGEPVVFALHLGTELNFDGRTLDMTSVARPVDSPVMAAIEAATQLAAMPKRRR